MSRKFVIGDKVVHRAGNGPAMAVRTVEGDYILARWYDKNMELKSAEFHPDELIHEDDLHRPIGVVRSRRSERKDW